MQINKLDSLPEDLKLAAQELIDNKFPEEAMTKTTQSNSLASGLSFEDLVRARESLQRYIPNVWKIRCRGYITGRTYGQDIAAQEGEDISYIIQKAVNQMQEYAHNAYQEDLTNLTIQDPKGREYDFRHFSSFRYMSDRFWKDLKPGINFMGVAS